MSDQFTGPLAADSAASIVLGPATPGRVTKEQLAAAERARLYHVNKLAAHRAKPLPEVDPLLAAPRPSPAESASDAGGAH